jgi:DNA-binding MarR family transcriptional regulator
MTTSFSIEQTTERASLLVKELMSTIIQRSAGEILAIMIEAGLSMPQMVTLCMLQRNGSHDISTIAAKLNLSLAATSHLVDRMVRQALVVRSEDADDRRHKRVVITASGVDLLDRVVQARTREIAQSLAGLPLDLREQLEIVLAQVLDHLKEAAL